MGLTIYDFFPEWVRQRDMGAPLEDGRKYNEARDEIERCYDDIENVPTEEIQRLLSCLAEWPETFTSKEIWLLCNGAIMKIRDLK